MCGLLLRWNRTCSFQSLAKLRNAVCCLKLSKSSRNVIPSLPAANSCRYNVCSNEPSGAVEGWPSSGLGFLFDAAMAGGGIAVFANGNSPNPPCLIASFPLICKTKICFGHKLHQVAYLWQQTLIEEDWSNQGIQEYGRGWQRICDIILCIENSTRLCLRCNTNFWKEQAKKSMLSSGIELHVAGAWWSNYGAIFGIIRVS